ncbi:oligosaccharide flippase family protein [Aquabacterium fontiphilum]|uniref:lipopolysaccharide biosynthesis protein n=1 Tax=Aquabacterium fontiphilum TaxID=450365 RepID=UPI001377BD8C|nr:oligosaccharide flippase family protein [Aquabacterium fontiphilum]NBD20702.1 oligosaccharide flippase family protein [Aquabacterium fontiphilum]
MPASLSVPRSAVGNLLAKLLIVGLGLAITVVVARQGPRVQGAFALFMAVESALLTLFSGLGLWLARQMSRQADAPLARARPMLLGVLRAAVGLGLLASLGLLAWSWVADVTPYSLLWLLALATPFLLLVPTATGLWLGQGRMLPINIAQVGAPALVLAGLGGAMWLVEGTQRSAPTILLVLIAWVSGKSLVAVLTAFWALRHASQRDDAVATGLQDTRLQRFEDERPRWYNDWRFVLTIGATNVVSLLNYRASLFLVERFHGLERVGTYSVAVTVAELLWLVSSAVTMSSYARIGHPDSQQAAEMTLRAVRFNVLATLAAAPVLGALAHWGVPWALGEAYAASVAPLLVLLPGVAAYAAASAFSAYYTNHLGRPHLSAAVAGLSLAISVAGGLLMIPAGGAVGAAAASTAGYTLAIVVACGLFLKHAGLPWRALWRAG